jgi:hypothetical protein
VIGRGIRYLGEAWLAYQYGDEAKAFIEQNLPQVSIALAIVIGVVGAAVIVWRRRMRRGDSPSPS